MILFEIKSKDSKNILCLQIGSGLIGKAISQGFDEKARLIDSFKTDWKDLTPNLNWLKELNLDITQYDRLEIIWAAGKVGFSATEKDIQIEKENFTKLINEFYNKFKQTSINIRFWLMSSAGGLFEGQKHINKENQPDTKRPYSILKHFQEELCVKIFGTSNTVLCRISSVYTKSNLSGRLGLIPVLMKNGIQNKVSNIFGSESTLRDYVLDEDIANYIVHHVHTKSQLSGVQYLVNGKSYSIQFIKNAIENIILKKLLLKYSLLKENAESISFTPKLKAKYFTASPMEANLKVLYLNLLNNRSN